ncbi:MAG TPA: hypothetical protein VIT45_14525 [Allosphingosinicella sp.]
MAKDAAISELSGSARLTPTALALALGATGKRAAELQAEDKMSLVQNLPETLVTPRPGGGREYSWDLEPTFRETLRGQPWDPVESPRLHVRCATRLPALPPTIKVEVSCSLCDVEITELELKDESIKGVMKSMVSNSMNEAAAIQHLKLILRDADLEPHALDNRFSELLLASIIAVPS